MSYWALAIINGRLAEFGFDVKGKKMIVRNHCYVDKSEYKTKKEQKWIVDDTKKYQFVYRNKKYRRIHQLAPKGRGWYDKV